MKELRFFPIPLLREYFMPVVSAWNLGIICDTQNRFLGFVEPIIIIFIIYGLR